jgi:hypothetical protein
MAMNFTTGIKLQSWTDCLEAESRHASMKCSHPAQLADDTNLKKIPHLLRISIRLVALHWAIKKPAIPQNMQVFVLCWTALKRESQSDNFL